MTQHKLTDLRRQVLLSAEGEWGLVQAGQRTGSVFREWRKQCEILVEMDYLLPSTKYKGSYYITDAGLRAVETTKQDVVARTKADRLASQLTSAKLELVECGLPKTARALDRVTKILGYEMAKRFSR